MKPDDIVTVDLSARDLMAFYLFMSFTKMNGSYDGLTRAQLIIDPSGTKMRSAYDASLVHALFSSYDRVSFFDMAKVQEGLENIFFTEPKELSNTEKLQRIQELKALLDN